MVYGEQGLTLEAPTRSAIEKDLVLAQKLWAHFEAIPGRVIVLMDLDEGKRGELFLPSNFTDDPGYGTRFEQRMLSATVIDADISRIPELVFGARVMVKPWDGLHMTCEDLTCTAAKFIPKGREVRFYRERSLDSVPVLLEE